MDKEKLHIAIKELDKFKEESIKEELSRYTDEYKNSEWFREPTLKDAVGDMINYDFTELYKYISSIPSDTERLKVFVALFTERAKEFGKSWWDEDLLRERCGYEYETITYIKLRNIVAKVVGIEPADWRDYYEGRGV